MQIWTATSVKFYMAGNRCAYQAVQRAAMTDENRTGPRGWGKPVTQLPPRVVKGPPWVCSGRVPPAVPVAWRPAAAWQPAVAVELVRAGAALSQRPATASGRATAGASHARGEAALCLLGLDDELRALDDPFEVTHRLCRRGVERLATWVKPSSPVACPNLLELLEIVERQLILLVGADHA